MLVEIGVYTLGIERIDSSAYFGVVKIGVGRTENIVLPLRTDREIAAHPLTFSHEIFLGDVGVEQKSIATAISCTDLKGSGRPFFHIDEKIDGVRLAGFLGRDLDVLEVTGSLQCIFDSGSPCYRKKAPARW